MLNYPIAEGMLKRKYRLSFRLKPKFQRTFKTPYFVLKAANNNLSYNRFGFMVSKRIDKKAVVRNKIKRLIRGGIEEFSKDLKEGHDMVFIAAKNAISASREEIKTAQKELFSKQGFLK